MSFCIDCGDDFRYDDCGGYNPPCACGAHCRSCHEASEQREAEWDDDDERQDQDDYSPGDRPSYHDQSGGVA